MPISVQSARTGSTPWALYIDLLICKNLIVPASLDWYSQLSNPIYHRASGTWLFDSKTKPNLYLEVLQSTRIFYVVVLRGRILGYSTTIEISSNIPIGHPLVQFGCVQPYVLEKSDKFTLDSPYFVVRICISSDEDVIRDKFPINNSESQNMDYYCTEVRFLVF